jgi:hypothetical protein
MVAKLLHVCLVSARERPGRFCVFCASEVSGHDGSVSRGDLSVMAFSGFGSKPGRRIRFVQLRCGLRLNLLVAAS